MPRILFLSLWAGKRSHVFLKSAQPQDPDLTSCLDPADSSLGQGVQGPGPRLWWLRGGPRTGAASWTEPWSAGRWGGPQPARHRVKRPRPLTARCLGTHQGPQAASAGLPLLPPHLQPSPEHVPCPLAPMHPFICSSIPAFPYTATDTGTSEQELGEGQHLRPPAEQLVRAPPSPAERAAFRDPPGSTSAARGGDGLGLGRSRGAVQTHRGPQKVPKSCPAWVRSGPSQPDTDWQSGVGRLRKRRHPA